MKTTLLSLLIAVPFAASGQKAPDVPRLSGIINLPGVKEAVFEFVSGPCDGPRQLVLREDQELWGLKVRKILPERGVAEVNVDGVAAPMVLTLHSLSNTASPAVAMTLNNASLQSVLELYGEFAGRTLLDWPVLPPLTFSLSASVTNKLDAAQVLQKALVEKGLATVPDGARFTMVVPSQNIAEVKPHAPRPESPVADKRRPEASPEGTIEFHGVDIVQAFDIYSMIIGGRFDSSAPRPQAPNPVIFLLGQSPLAKEEAVYALDTLFGWRGIKMVRSADGTVRAVQQSTR